jgi:hypothetical protein
MRFLPKASFPEWMLRSLLALSFLYPPVDALGDPYSWIGYFPTFLTDLVAPHGILLLHAFGIVEVLLALWVLLAKDARKPALIMGLMLIAIVAFNPGQFQVLFRDVCIALAALALLYFPRPHHGLEQ